jgi:hypothetical protein
VKGTCATVKMVCESNDLNYRGALLNAEVIERMLHDQLDLVRELEDEGAEPDHIAAVLALLDDLEGAEEMLRLKVLPLAQREGWA